MGGRKINNNRSSLFWSCIDSYNLLDLGFEEGRYTWSNHRNKYHGSRLIMEQLDRVFANEQWLEFFPRLPTLQKSIPITPRY